MKTLTRTSATNGQIKQITRVGQDAVEKAVNDFGLDKDGAQRIHGNAEFAARIREATTLALQDMSVSDKFKNEEVSSTYAYPQGYRRKDQISQETRLVELFPGIGFSDEKLWEAPIPQGAEGWFAIPKWEKFGATYQEAVEKVLAKLAETRTDGFQNYRQGVLGPEYLRRTDRTAKMMKRLADAQPDHDILVVAAQFGLRHRGRSVRRAREVFMGNEFGLGAFEVGIMALTHPERFVRWEQLHTDCPGDEYSPGADGQFDYAPFFRWDGGELRFVTRWFDFAREVYGSVSAFLPQE